MAPLSRLRPDPVLIDWVLAGLLTAGGQLAVWLGADAGDNRQAGALFAAAIMAPVAVRRRYPTVVGTAVPVLSAADHMLWNPSFIGYPIATFCALYALTVWTIPPRRFALCVALLAAAFLATSLAPGGSLPAALPFTVVTVVVMLLIRRVVGDRDRRARVAERERDVAAREAVVEERARIARELHDVIAHHVSMIVLQAGAERRVLGADGSTRDVLTTIEEIGRSALTEMRRLLGMLRSDGPEPLAPQPGLSDLPALIAQVTEAGLPVELEIHGEPRDLPAGIELSAFRIVQEALTNALRHAGHARAQVSVRYNADVLEIEVADDGTDSSRAANAGGHGLVGMRERAALYGGHFDAGHRPTGGFAVRVLLPVR